MISISIIGRLCSILITSMYLTPIVVKCDLDHQYGFGTSKEKMLQTVEAKHDSDCAAVEKMNQLIMQNMQDTSGETSVPTDFVECFDLADSPNQGFEFFRAAHLIVNRKHQEPTQVSDDSGVLRDQEKRLAAEYIDTVSRAMHMSLAAKPTRTKLYTFYCKLLPDEDKLRVLEKFMTDGKYPDEQIFGPLEDDILLGVLNGGVSKHYYYTTKSQTTTILHKVAAHALRGEALWDVQTSIKLMSLVLNNGADINAKDYAQNTPLLHAFKESRPLKTEDVQNAIEILNFMVHGEKADISMVNKYGENVLMHAHHPDIFKFLLGIDKGNKNVFVEQIDDCESTQCSAGEI